MRRGEEGGKKGQKQAEGGLIYLCSCLCVIFYAAMSQVIVFMVS